MYPFSRNMHKHRALHRALRNDPYMHDLLTSANVAQQAGVSIATVSREVSRGNLTPTYEHPGPNGMRLFAPDEVDRWIKARIKASA